MSTPAEDIFEQLLIIVEYFVTDRTTADVMALKVIGKTAYDDMTAEQQDLIVSDAKGAYNAYDLNRVSLFCNTFHEYIELSGYIIENYIELKTDWTKNDIPTAIQLQEYISIVTTIRDIWCDVDLALPDNLNHGLTVDQANNIELCLIRCLETVKAMDGYKVYCGQVNCGQLVYF